MKAVAQDTYGSEEVLQLKNVDQPVAGDDDILVRVRATGVDPRVWHLMTGLQYLVRVMGFGMRRPKSPELTETRKVTPTIDRTYPLPEVPDAIRYLEKGHARGKVVIAV